MVQVHIAVIVTGTRTPVLGVVPAGQSDWISSRRACCAAEWTQTSVRADGGRRIPPPAGMLRTLQQMSCTANETHAALLWLTGGVWHFGRCITPLLYWVLSNRSPRFKWSLKRFNYMRLNSCSDLQRHVSSGCFSFGYRTSTSTPQQECDYTYIP